VASFPKPLVFGVLCGGGGGILSPDGELSDIVIGFSPGLTMLELDI
jgi:hypothetical protein